MCRCSFYVGSHSLDHHIVQFHEREVVDVGCNLNEQGEVQVGHGDGHAITCRVAHPQVCKSFQKKILHLSTYRFVGDIGEKITLIHVQDE